MPIKEKTVFISYRRTNFPWALNIYQYLTKNGYDVTISYAWQGSTKTKTEHIDTRVWVPVTGDVTWYWD